MNTPLERIAKEISDIVGNQVSPEQLHSFPAKARNGFIQVTPHIKVMTSTDGIPNCVEFNVDGRRYATYQVSCYKAGNVIEAWDLLLTRVKDMFVNPGSYSHHRETLIGGV